MGVKIIFENNILIIDLIEVVFVLMLKGKINSLCVFYYFMGLFFGWFGEGVVGLFGGCYLGFCLIDLYIKGFEVLGVYVINEYGVMYLRIDEVGL